MAESVGFGDARDMRSTSRRPGRSLAPAYERSEVWRVIWDDFRNCLIRGA